jgi:hypothetical protein
MVVAVAYSDRGFITSVKEFMRPRNRGRSTSARRLETMKEPRLRGSQSGAKAL